MVSLQTYQSNIDHYRTALKMRQNLSSSSVVQAASQAHASMARLNNEMIKNTERLRPAVAMMSTLERSLKQSLSIKEATEMMSVTTSIYESFQTNRMMATLLRNDLSVVANMTHSVFDGLIEQLNYNRKLLGAPTANSSFPYAVSDIPVSYDAYEAIQHTYYDAGIQSEEETFLSVYRQTITPVNVLIFLCWIFGYIVLFDPTDSEIQKLLYDQLFPLALFLFKLKNDKES